MQFFNFRKKKLNHVTAGLASKFDQAALIENQTDRVEALVLLRSEAAEKLDSVDKPEGRKGMYGFMAFLTGTAFSMPVVTAIGGAYFIKKWANSNRTELDKQALLAKIDAEIAKVVENKLEDALASPAFVKSIRSSFKKASETTDSDYAEIVKRTTKPTAPKPV